jgi:exopolysaccharide biosynthesis polyprenyl glycosylphosphotransferase
MIVEPPPLANSNGTSEALASSQGMQAVTWSSLTSLGKPVNWLVLPLADLATCSAVQAWAVSSFDADSLQGRWVLFGVVLIQITIFALFLANGLYDRKVLHGVADILRAALLPGAVALAASAVAGEIAYGDGIGTVLGGLALVSCAAMAATRIAWLRLIMTQGRTVDDPVTLIGSREDISEFLLAAAPAHRNVLNLRFMAYLVGDPADPAKVALEVPGVDRFEGAGAVRSLLACLPLNTTLILVIRDHSQDSMRSVMPYLLETSFAVRLASVATLRLRTLRPIPDLDASVMIQPASITPGQWAAKRTLDITLASAALLLLWPVLVLTAVAIKLDSPGPIFFFQERHGLNNRRFRIIKFRTMYHDAHARFEQARRHDPRVTRIGALLRRTSIDELPQLFNVLDGSMSLVGPRPHPIELNDKFAPFVDGMFARHRLPPGLTGLAQVNGSRGETPSIEIMQDRVDFDLRYIGSYNLWNDVRIIVMTFVMVVLNKNAY